MRAKMLSLLDTSLVTQVLNTLEPRESSGEGLLRVLTYHRVDTKAANPELSPSLLSAIPTGFAEQMQFIRKVYQPVSLTEVLAAVRGESRLPEAAVLVTFDDAYSDFKEQAWPILKSCDIPTVLFVPTAFPNQAERRFWWDRVYHALQTSPKASLMLAGLSLQLDSSEGKQKAFKLLRNHIKSLAHTEAMNFVDRLCDALESKEMILNKILTWDEIRQLASEGLSIGAHSRNHPMLNRLSLDEAAREACDSLADLQEQIGAVPPVFAYPSGGATPLLAKCLAMEGFELAFTTERGINQLQKDNPLLLKRINIGLSTSLNVMRLQLLHSVASLL